MAGTKDGLLRLAGYYRQFVPGFAKIAAPLHAILPPLNQGKAKPKKETGSGCTNGIQQLKADSHAGSCLGLSSFRETLHRGDGRIAEGLGACLSLVGEDGGRHPKAYASHGLRGAEVNYPDYSSFKLELLALK